MRACQTYSVGRTRGSNVTFGTIMVAGSLAAAACLVIVHLLPTGVDPIGDPVSNYGAGPFRIWYQAAAVALGACSFAAAGFLLTYTTNPRMITVAAFALAGIARWAITAFPTDLSDRPETSTGRIHNLLAMIGFGGIATGAATFAGAVASLEWLKDVDRLLDQGGAVVVLASAIMVAGLVVPQLGKVFGAIERVFYICAIVWFIAVGALITVAAR